MELKQVDVAAEIGLSAPRLGAIEAGGVLSGEELRAVWNWMTTPAAKATEGGGDGAAVS